MSMLRRVSIAAAGLALLPGAAHALPLVDVEAGARYWQANPSGDVAYKGDAFVVADNLGFDKEWTPNLYARAALPFITVDAEYTKLDFDGKAEKSGEWGGQTFSTGVNSSLEARLLHAGAMFNVPLPIIDVGLGLGATQIQADAKVQTAVSEQEGTTDVTLPVAKGELRVDVPLLPLTAGVRGQYIGFQGDGFRDVTAEVGYELGLVQIRGGYRQIKMKYDGDDLDVDTGFSGPFAGVHVAF